MMFVIGPVASGKRSFVTSLAVKPESVGWIDDMDYLSVADGELPAYADGLNRRYQVLVGTEIGCGLVPVDATERQRREKAGRLHCLVARLATTVVRLYCGIPQTLKGTLPPLIEGDAGNDETRGGYADKTLTVPLLERDESTGQHPTKSVEIPPASFGKEGGNS